MHTHEVSSLLKFALRLDGAGSLACGLLSCALAAPLATAVGAPVGWVTAIGAFMIGYGLLVGWLAQLGRLDARFVWVVVIGNLLWAIESVALLFTGWITPNTVGISVILTQAVLVAGFSQLQYLGLRSSQRLASRR